MPELPEVETIIRGLAPHLIDQPIVSVTILAPSSIWLGNERGTGEVEARQFANQLVGQTMTAVARRGKMIIIELTNNLVLLIHLKMTGQLIYIHGDQRVAGGHPTADMFGGLPNKSTRVIFQIGEKGTLYFNDQRRFGYTKLLQKDDLQEHKAYKQFGLEPLESTFDEQSLYSVAKRKANLRIKQALLDQTLIAGIGNIYADESLFEAGIHPARLAGSLNQDEVAKLTAAIKTVLQRGLQYGGTSSQHFVQADGSKGSMQDHLNVYRRTGLPCPNCGTPIERIVIGGRGTHFCPNCQNLESST